MSNLLEYAKGLNYSGNFSLSESIPLFRGQLDGISPELISSVSQSNVSKEILKPVITKPISPIKNDSSLLDAAQAGKMRVNIDPPKGLFDKINDKLDSAGNKVNESGFGKFMDKSSPILGAANGLAKAANTMFHGHRTGLQKTDEGALKIRDAQYSVLKKIPVTAPFAKAAELLDNTLGAITGGLGSATKADKVLTSLPLLGNTAAIFAGKTDTFKGDIQDINTGDFGGTVADSTRAQELSGVKSVAKKKLNRQIRSAQHDFTLAADAIDYNTLRKNNNIGQDLQSAMLSKYQGNQQIMLSKKGSKLIGLDEAKRLLKESKKINNNLKAGRLKTINTDPISNAVSDTIMIADNAKNGFTGKELQEVLLNLIASATGNNEYKIKELIDNNKDYFINLFNKSGYSKYVSAIENGDYETIINVVNSIFPSKFKSGGKIEKENIIPTGALHKNLHHIDDIGIDITKKGIPVVTMDEGGEFKEQIAEVEAAEWTLSLDVTKQIEEYWNNYKESGDDNIAIECGKYLVDQIFNNTRDDDKVIKKTE